MKFRPRWVFRMTTVPAMPVFSLGNARTDQVLACGQPGLRFVAAQQRRQEPKGRS